MVHWVSLRTVKAKTAPVHLPLIEVTAKTGAFIRVKVRAEVKILDSRDVAVPLSLAGFREASPK